MKLHYSPASTTSLPIVLFCNEARIPFEPIVIDLMTGQHKSPAYLAVNPWGKVPVLDDEGFVLTESSAILKYIADKVGSPAYPRDLRARARVNERMDWINTEIYRDLGYHLVYPQVLPNHTRPNETEQSGTVAWGKDKAMSALSVLDGLIGDRPYLCGDEITIADYFGAQLLHVGSLVRASYAKYPNLHRWYERMKSLPSWPQVNQVFDGLGAALASKPFVTL